jgi:nucleoside-diphosphate-sugar epimerase
LSKILVTGGAGFIGHNVVTELTRDGHDVSIIDNFTNYDFINQIELNYLYSYRLSKLKMVAMYNNNINTVDTNSVFLRAHPDIVIHTASFPRQKIVNENPALGSETMITGLIKLLEECKKHDVKRFVYVSSSMVYGNFVTDPITEDAACTPIGQYAIMKYAGELIVKDYANRLGIEYTIIRPSAVYGELDSINRVISQFVCRALQSKTLTVRGSKEVLDFTYVSDAVNGIVLAATSEVSNETYNITRGTERYTLLDAANLIVDLIGTGNIEIEERDLSFPTRGLLDITKARTDLNYNPKVSFKEGIEKYINWYKKHPELLN